MAGGTEIIPVITASFRLDPIIDVGKYSPRNSRGKIDNNRVGSPGTRPHIETPGGDPNGDAGREVGVIHQGGKLGPGLLRVILGIGLAGVGDL